MKRLTAFVMVLCFLFPIQGQEEIEQVKKMTQIQPLDTFFEPEDLIEQVEVEIDPYVKEAIEASRSLVGEAALMGGPAAATTCSVTGNVLSILSPDRKYSFTFAMLRNCGKDQVLFSRGVDIRVNGRIVKNWERRKIALTEMRELLYRQGEGVKLQSAASPDDASRITPAASSPSGNSISLPGWVEDLIKGIISIVSEVCQLFGGDKEICDFVEGALKLLSDIVIKKAKDNVFFDEHSILPTLYFSNAKRYGAKKESIEAYIWTATVLQGRPAYTPHQRLYLIVSQTMAANRDSRAGQAWARTVEQLPR